MKSKFNQKYQHLPFSPESSSFWDSLPSTPGIYIFEDKNLRPLYIGKSISLKSRLKQHYEGHLSKNTKAQNFVPLTHTLTLVEVKNDLEATIIEANYIKTYKPRYNSASKDDKSNIYLVFTNYPDTKIKIIHSTDVRTLELDDIQKQVFGPYTSTQVAETILKEVRRIFGYCQKPFNNQSKACFYYHLQNCPGACNGQITIKQYQKHLNKIRRFLSGNFDLLKKKLKRQINLYAKTQRYEQAQVLKNQYQKLQQTLDKDQKSLLLKLADVNDQLLPLISKKLKHPKLKTSPRRIECYDMAHLQGDSYVGSMVVFVNNRPSTKDYRRFKIQLPDKSDTYAMKQVLTRRFNHPEWETPDLIILDGGVPQLSICEKTIPDSIPVIGLAKKKETILFYNEDHKITTLNLDLDDPVLNLFQNLRDEAHRFATTYHQKLHRHKIIDS